MKNKSEIYGLRDWKWEGEAEEKLGRVLLSLFLQLTKKRAIQFSQATNWRWTLILKSLKKKKVEIWCDGNRIEPMRIVKNLQEA